MGTYDTKGGHPLHDPAFDTDPPCDICGSDPASCDCYETPLYDSQGNSFHHVVALDRETGVEVAYFDVEFASEYAPGFPKDRKPTEDQLKRVDEIAVKSVGYFVGGDLDGQEAW